MKQELSKKLILKKSILTNLDQEALEKMVGGGDKYSHPQKSRCLSQCPGCPPIGQGSPL